MLQVLGPAPSPPEVPTTPPNIDTKLDQAFAPPTDAEKAEWRGLELLAKLELVTQEDLAAALGLKAVQTLELWRQRGEGPKHVKLGKSVFYRLVDIHSWVQSEVRVSTKEQPEGEDESQKGPGMPPPGVS